MTKFRPLSPIRRGTENNLKCIAVLCLTWSSFSLFPVSSLFSSGRFLRRISWQRRSLGTVHHCPFYCVFLSPSLVAVPGPSRCHCCCSLAQHSHSFPSKHQTSMEHSSPGPLHCCPSLSAHPALTLSLSVKVMVLSRKGSSL